MNKNLKCFVMLIVALFFLTNCSTAPLPVVSDNVQYIIEPIQFEGQAALKFKLSFIGQASGKTFLELPSKWASESEYYKDIKEFKVLSPGVVLENGAKPYIKTLSHAPSQQIVLSYILTQQKPQGLQPFRALIDKDYFHFVGYSAFVSPNSAENITQHYEVLWKNFPSSFKFANSFNSDSDHLLLQTNLGTLKRSVFVGGDFRIKKVLVKSNPVYMAVRGLWNFTDEEFFNASQKIAENERDFWQDHNFPYFFIVLIPDVYHDHGSSSGTSLTNSFAMAMTKELTLTENMVPLLAHELFHTWNGEKMQQKAPERYYYWFSEGFTNYYSRLLNLRAGLIDLPAYVQEVNNVIFDYYTSPVRSASNKRVEKEFWSNELVSKLPYYRGDLLAMNWDAKIKSDSKNGRKLDQFMMALYEQSKIQNPIVEDNVIRSLLVKDIPNIANDLRAYIWQGNMITPDEKALGPCVKREFISIGKFEHGFDSEKTYSSGVVTGLKNGSPAQLAGLREGMKIIDRKMSYPPFGESKIKVLSHGLEKWISFVPAGQKKYLMPHFILNERQFKKDPKKCLAFF